MSLESNLNSKIERLTLKEEKFVSCKSICKLLKRDLQSCLKAHRLTRVVTNKFKMLTLKSSGDSNN